MADKKPIADEAGADASASSRASALPLFFRQPHPVLPTRHEKSGLKRLKGFAFAADTNSVVLNMAEFFEAARSYPIVFTTTGRIMPVALLGLQERNRFLDSKGNWLPNHYIPAYIRRYPFIFMQDNDQRRLILCVDEAAPHFMTENPEMRFFSDTGEMTEFSTGVLEFCTHYQQQHVQTVAFCEALVEHGLLVERATSLKLPGGKEFSLSGFSMLDAERFAALPDAVYLEWRKKGWLAAAHAALLSYANWKYLAELPEKKA